MLKCQLSVTRRHDNSGDDTHLQTATRCQQRAAAALRTAWGAAAAAAHLSPGVVARAAPHQPAAAPTLDTAGFTTSRSTGSWSHVRQAPCSFRLAVNRLDMVVDCMHKRQQGADIWSPQRTSRGLKLGDCCGNRLGLGRRMARSAHGTM